MNTPTPRTDEEIEDWSNGLKHMADDHLCCRSTVLDTIEFLNELKRERDQLRKVAADFHDCMVDVRQQMQMDKMLRQPIPRAPLELQIDETIELYDSLPHIVAKGETK